MYAISYNQITECADLPDDSSARIFLDWVSASNLGNIASIAGLLVALAGFTFTIAGVRNSKKAALRAEAAAIAAVDGIKYFDTISEISNAITVAEEIIRLNRAGEWKVILDRHSHLRHLLIRARSANPHFDEKQKARIQSTIAQSSTMSKQIDSATHSGKQPKNVVKMNEILGLEIEFLTASLAELKAKLEN